MISTSKFSLLLIEWHKTIIREMPWKGDKDPYKIWISEIILQQTRVSQGIPYYLRFIKTFPDIKALAKADEDAVLKLWQGLGYYSRARNLLATAKIIVNEHNGVFPSEIAAILKLKGIGPYTAAAIASFAFDQKIPVIDGNVMRLMSRIFGIYDPIDISTTYRAMNQLLLESISMADPANFNQAIMDYGATVCTPKNPSCEECVYSIYCIAKANDDINLLPIKSKSIKKTTRYFNYFFLLAPEKNLFLIHKRTEEDIWKGLYQLPLYETSTEENLSIGQIQKYLTPWLKLSTNSSYVARRITTKKHLLTHQTLKISFYILEIQPYEFELTKGGMIYVSNRTYEQYGFPKVIADFLANFFEV